MPIFLHKHDSVGNDLNSSPFSSNAVTRPVFFRRRRNDRFKLNSIYRLIRHFDRSCLFTGRDKLAASLLQALLCRMRQKPIAFITVILIMLVTGVFWGTWFTLTRSLNDFSPGEFIHIGKTIIANVAVPMRILMPATLLFLLLSMRNVYHVNKPVFYFYTASFLLMVVTLVITVGVEVPIDNQIKGWTVETIPANWKSLRQTWDEFHMARTFTSIASFAFYVSGMLKRMV